MKLWKKLCILKRQEMILLFAIQNVGFLIGLIFTIISARAGEAVPIGFMLGIGAVFCCVYFSGMFFLAQDYNMALKMGETRKRFLFPYLLFTMGELICSCAYNIILLQIEKAVVYAAGYGKIKGMQGMDFYKVNLLFVYFTLLVYGISIVAVFGAFFVRFGKKAFWTLWFIWMFVCIGGSRLAGWAADHPKSVLYQAGNSIFSGMTRNEPLTYLKGLVCIAAAAGISWLVLRKEAVNP